MATLPDCFCLFNRARGTEMVSPDDLLLACGLFQKLGLPVAFRAFQPTNVLVIQSSAHSDAKVCLADVHTCDFRANESSLTLTPLHHTRCVSASLRRFESPRAVL